MKNLTVNGLGLTAAKVVRADEVADHSIRLANVFVDFCNTNIKCTFNILKNITTTHKLPNESKSVSSVVVIFVRNSIRDNVCFAKKNI